MKYVYALLLSIFALGQINAQAIFCNYVIWGNVTDANNNPVGNINIQVAHVDTAGNVVNLMVMQTNANGSYGDTVCVFTPQARGHFRLSALCSPVGTSVVDIPINPNQYIYNQNISCSGSNNPCSLFLSSQLDTSTYTTTFWAISGTSTWPGFNSYLWSFNGANGPWTSGGMTVSHTYPGPGTYNACVIGLDTITGCSDTTCVSFIYGSGSGSCSVTLTDSLLSGPPNVYQLHATANGTAPFTYSWSYDGGATWSSGGSSQVVTVNTFGLNICVRITDATNCVAQKCVYLAPAASSNCIYVYGSVSDNLGVGRAGVWIEVYDLVNGGATLVHSMLSDVGGNYGDTICFNHNNLQGTIRIDAHCDTTTTPVSQLKGYSPNGIIQAHFQNCQAGSGGGTCAMNLSLQSITGLNAVFAATFNTTSTVNGYEFSTDGGATWGAPQTSSTFSHTFGSSGTYTVCARATDAVNCTAQDCRSVVVSSNPNNQFLCGFVTAGNTSLVNGDAMVLLVQYDSIAGTLTAFDSTFVDSSGYYYFGQIPTAAWLVKAFLMPQSTAYANYLPTYYGNALFWSQAVYAYTPNTPIGNTCITNISLVAGNNPGGPGFIGGLVSQGANISGGTGQENTGPGDPVANALVMLLDGSDNPIAYTYTNAQGQFSFNALAYGTYKVYTEVLGIPTDPYWVTIDAQTPSYSGVDVVVNSTSVTTGLDFVRPELLNVKLFPNPVNETLTIDFGKNQTIDFEIRISNLIGNKILTRSVDGSKKVGINLQNLPSGLFLVEILNDQNLLGSQRILKK